jgi:hypothetical protein
MATKLDGKFHGVIVKNKDGSIVPQDQWIVFLAKDNCLPPTLYFYLAECQRQVASFEQTEAVRELLERVLQWRSANPAACKTPDVQVGEIVT